MQSLGDYEFLSSDILGHGAFALVFKGCKKGAKHEEVAIKKIKKSSFVSLNLKERKEISILKELEHENIVRLLEYHENKIELYLVLEFCNLGDYNEFLQKHHHLSEQVIRYLFFQIGNAIHFIHSHYIIHRDLKPQNILLHTSSQFISNSSFKSLNQLSSITAKIADFGFARVLSDTTMATTLCGSPLYMAPEVLLGETYDSKVDMWSIGAIIYQSFTGFAPFTAKTPQMLKKRFETDKLLQPSIPKNASYELRSLLFGLLRRNSNMRIGYIGFCSHSFFNNSLPHQNQNLFDKEDHLVTSLSKTKNSSGYLPSGHQYMFIKPDTNKQNLVPFSLDPPVYFEVSPNSRLSNQLNYSNFETNVEDENDITQNEYIFINGDSLSEKEKKLCSSKSSNDDKEIPFSSLGGVKIETKTICESLRKNENENNDFFKCDILNSIIDDQNVTEYYSDIAITPTVKEESMIRLNRNPGYSNIQFNNAAPSSDEFKQPQIFFKEEDKKDLDSKSFNSVGIPTMFGFSINKGSCHSPLNISNSLLQLKSIKCPFYSSNTESIFFENIQSNDKYYIDNQRKLLSNSISRNMLPPQYRIESEPSLLENLSYNNGGKVILEDLKFDISHIFKPDSISILDSSKNQISKRLIEECLQSILYSQYIFDIVNNLRCPLLSSSTCCLENILYNPKNELMVNLKIGILSVKLVSLLIDTLEKIKLHNSMMSSRIPALTNITHRLIHFLELSNTQLLYIQRRFEQVQKNHSFLRTILPAETIIFNQLVGLCQNYILENCFDNNKEFFSQKNDSINNICQFLYLSAFGISFSFIDPFLKLTSKLI